MELPLCLKKKNLKSGFMFSDKFILNMFVSQIFYKNNQKFKYQHQSKEQGKLV